MTRTAISALTIVLVPALFAGAVLADAAGDYETLFGAEARKVAASPQTSDDTAFAATLLKAAASLEDSPALQVLLREKAYAFGIKGTAGYETALAAAKLLMKTAPERKEQWRENLLKVLQLRYTRRRAKARAAAGAELLDQLIAAADAAMAAGQATQALALYRRARAVAGALRSPRRAEILAMGKTAAARVAIERKIGLLEAKLKKDPADSDAREDLIRACLLGLDNPAKAAALLTDDVDEVLRMYVPMAAGPVEEINETGCSEMARWYESLASKVKSGPGKVAGLRRAGGYYQRFLSLHQKDDGSGLKARLALARIEKELARLGAHLPGGAAALPPGAVLALSFDKHTLFEKGGATCARDLSGKGNNARAIGATWTAKGVSGGAFDFDGKDDYLDCGHGESLNIKGPMTISMWVNLRGWDHDAGLCTKGVGRGGESWLLDMGGRGVRFLRRPTTVTPYAAVTTGKAITPGKWHHIVAIADGKRLRIYLDLAETRGPAYSKASQVNTHIVSIGSRQSGSGPYDANVAGLIDEVAVWPRALTPEEVKKLHEAHMPATKSKGK